MNGLSGVMRKIEETKGQYEQQKDLMTSRRVTLEQFLLQIDASIAKTLDEIATTENTIMVKQSEISVKQNAMAELQRKIVKNKHVILEYLSYIYTK
jgi:septal ring factor EnvC (AmiA/AmiB activator)